MERVERVALFPGSFDPFTRGHAAIVESALGLFDRVVIGVGSNISKRGLLSSESRVRLIEDIYSGEDRVEVKLYEGMTGEFARTIGARVIVRGVRGAQDLDMERTIATVNKELYSEIESVMLFTPASMLHISSSCVRELLAFGQDVKSLLVEGTDLDKYLIK